MLSPLQFLHFLGIPARDFLGVGAAVERADAEIAFALRAKTAAGRDDHVRLVQILSNACQLVTPFGVRTQM
jgi:hypothetical protein